MAARDGDSPAVSNGSSTVESVDQNNKGAVTIDMEFEEFKKSLFAKPQRGRY